MKRFTTALLSIAMLAGVSGAALAADSEVPATDYAAMGWYLRGDAGWSWLAWSENGDDALAVGGGFGYQYNENLRGDLRVDWSGNFELNNGRDMDVTTVLGNMYFDIPTETMFTPYLGAGAGYGWGTVENGKDRDGFAFALMAGTAIELTDNFAADVGYRYRQVVTDQADPQEHQLLVGVRYKF
ncbi:porin family protein [Aestuariivirga sp.]|uniref:porin family protein n=1 Tax=Aestuariivirga sp. TaxID=2650926 RepID=UPI003594125C